MKADATRKPVATAGSPVAECHHDDTRRSWGIGPRRHTCGADSWRARSGGPEVTQEITVAAHAPQGGGALAKVLPPTEPQIIPLGSDLPPEIWFPDTGRPVASAQSPGRRVSREPVWNFYPTKTTCSAVAQCSYGRT